MGTRVIIHADDFGVSEAVNRAVVEGHRRGVLTSCSVMASGEAFDSAVRLALECPGLGVGLHLVTVLGCSILPHRDIPSLVDRSGRFPSDPTWAGLRYFFCRKSRSDLRREISAQFEAVLSSGIPITHIDSHLHLHVHPVIFELAVELGKRYGVRRMRVPEDDPDLAKCYLGGLPPGRALESRIFRLLTKRMRKRLRVEGFSCTDRVYGHLLTGRMTEDYLLFLLERLTVPTCEIYFHPAWYDDRLSLTPAQRQARKEFDALLSPRVAERLSATGLMRGRYCDLNP